MEYESLTSLLSSIFLCEDDVDICFWKPSRSEAFSAKSFSRELDAKLVIISPCSLVWDGLAPPWVFAEVCLFAFFGPFGMTKMVEFSRILFIDR